MRFNFVLLGLLLSFALDASELRPCQRVEFDKIAFYAMPEPGNRSGIGFTPKGRKNALKLLKKCIKNYAVCIVEGPPKSLTWLNKKLIAPTNEKHFDPVTSELLYGLLQYKDEKTGHLICIVAVNTQTQAAPWVGASWTIDGDNITEMELYADRLTTVMTPKSLYETLLETYENDLRNEEYKRQIRGW